MVNFKDYAEMWLKTLSVMGWVKNIVRTGKNAGDQDFLLFPTIFSKAFFFMFVEKLELCGQK